MACSIAESDDVVLGHLGFRPGSTLEVSPWGLPQISLDGSEKCPELDGLSIGVLPLYFRTPPPRERTAGPDGPGMGLAWVVVAKTFELKTQGPRTPNGDDWTIHDLNGHSRMWIVHCQVKEMHETPKNAGSTDFRNLHRFPDHVQYFLALDFPMSMFFHCRSLNPS